jgi:hypothetical protein
MTEIEKKVANRLMRCTFLPGSFHKRFVKQLKNWADRDMTEKGRALMIDLFHRYRNQIFDYHEINLELNPDAYQLDLQAGLFGDEVNIKPGPTVKKTKHH